MGVEYKGPFLSGTFESGVSGRGNSEETRITIDTSASGQMFNVSVEGEEYAGVSELTITLVGEFEKEDFLNLMHKAIRPLDADWSGK